MDATGAGPEKVGFDNRLGLVNHSSAKSSLVAHAGLDGLAVISGPHGYAFDGRPVGVASVEVFHHRGAHALEGRVDAFCLCFGCFHVSCFVYVVARLARARVLSFRRLASSRLWSSGVFAEQFDGENPAIASLASPPSWARGLSSQSFGGRQLS